MSRFLVLTKWSAASGDENARVSCLRPATPALYAVEIMTPDSDILVTIKAHNPLSAPTDGGR